MTESDEVMARVQKDFKANQDTLDKTLARNAKIEADKKLYGKLTDSDRIKVDAMVEQGEAEMLNNAHVQVESREICPLHPSRYVRVSRAIRRG